MSGEPTTGDGAAGDEDAAGSVGDAAPAPRRRSRVATLVRGVFFVAGVAFLVLTVARTWPEITDVIAGHTPAVIGAGVLAAGSVVAFAQAWVAMFPGSHRARVAASFYIGQLAKYIPGGMLGIVGQVAFMRDAGVPLRHAATAFVVFAFTLVVGSMMSAFPLVLDADVPTILRLAGVGGLATVVLAWRPWFVTALSLVSRVLRRPVVPPSTIADQRQITLSVVWSLGGAVASGLAFAVAADLVAEVPPLTAMAAFGLAWAVGFVAVPLPAGLGLREAVLVLALTGIAGVDADAVIAASLVHRFVLLSAELVMFAQSRLRLLVRPGAAATISPAAPTSSSSSSHMSQPEEGR